MPQLTKKYIFQCKLRGESVEFDTGVLYHKEIHALLVKTGVWKKDPIFTNKFWNEYAFTILYPVRIIDDDGKPNLLLEGYHHTVCM